MPLVDGEEAVGSDGDDGGVGQAGLGVGRHMADGGVGGELEHHDDVLLHLLCEHQRRLQEEILLRPMTGREREREPRAEEDGRRGRTGGEDRRGGKEGGKMEG